MLKRINVEFSLKGNDHSQRYSLMRDAQTRRKSRLRQIPLRGRRFFLKARKRGTIPSGKRDSSLKDDSSGEYISRSCFRQSTTPAPHFFIFLLFLFSFSLPHVHRQIDGFTERTYRRGRRHIASEQPFKVIQRRCVGRRGIVCLCVCRMDVLPTRK